MLEKILEANWSSSGNAGALLVVAALFFVVQVLKLPSVKISEILEQRWLLYSALIMALAIIGLGLVKEMRGDKKQSTATQPTEVNQTKPPQKETEKPKSFLEEGKRSSTTYIDRLEQKSTSGSVFGVVNGPVEINQKNGTSVEIKRGVKEKK